ncbi:MAG: M23 family metallopeptidase [Candidatus Vogelbacteria bacterium]|nr:M23 family metallopeptidase [Candidatus Vogelbacteria bacterium]
MVLVLTFSFAFPAKASLTSFVAGLLTDTTQAANNYDNAPETRTINSQNVAILAAAMNSDPVISAEGSTTDLTIVNDSALMSVTGPLGTIADVEDFGAGADTISVYTVREGDTIQKVANMFGVSANTIIWGNDLRGPKDIKLGQELVILPVSGVKYTIKRGDSIKSIAKRYGGDVDEIVKFNGLEYGQKLVLGGEIIIPNGEFRVTTPSRLRPGPTKLILTYIDETINSLDYYIRPILHGRKTQGLHGKNGVDIAPDCRCSGREPLLAAAAGQVLVAKSGGWNGGYGNYVVIAHPNGTQTLYGHMASVSVRSGATVGQGERIGYVGSTGNSSGPHVHFEIRGARNPF